MKTAPPRLTARDSRKVKPPEKRADAIYATPEYRAWRARVIRHAGARCEWVERGQRCIKAEPLHRMFADHRVELRDGGAPFDPMNGQCLCGAHHTMKTDRERARRMAE
jgi:5-methylcytosine-specific restriction enzyme A